MSLSEITLRAQIITLAQLHRRYSTGMIYPKLRQPSLHINHKRWNGCMQNPIASEAAVAQEGTATDRQPLGRPQVAMVNRLRFDCTAQGSVIKNLTVVDDATHEAVAIVSERAIREQSTGAHSGSDCHRRCERITEKVLRPCDADLVHERGVKVFLIESGKPKQNAYIESFNRCFRDKCLNERRFTSLSHAQVMI